MCRLALIDKKGIKYIVENYGLENLFNYLEQQLGGHGNGYCIIHNDGSYCINKGVTLSNNTIVDEILKEIDDIRWVIYHTRLASIGVVSNRNCHPFEHKGRVMVMNGTERNYPIINTKLTDTENILLGSENILNDTKDYHSVFLGYENGRVFANKNSGSLKYIACGNGGKIFASSFPIEYYKKDKVYEAPQSFVEGDTIKGLRQATLSCYGYYNRNRNMVYDDYYYMGLR